MKSPVHGILKDVPISFGQVVEPIYFFVIEGSPYKMIIGHQTMCKMNGVIDCGKHCFCLVKDVEHVTIPLVYSTSEMAVLSEQSRLDGGAADCEDFTSDSESTEWASVSIESSEEKFVMMITDEGPDKSPTEEELIVTKLTHLDRNIRRELSKMLLEKVLIALSLDDMRPPEVPVEHDFEMKNDQPIYHKSRRISPKHNTIVKEEIENMFRAGVVKPISSAW